MAGVTFGRRMKTNLRFDCELSGGNSNMFYVSPKKTGGFEMIQFDGRLHMFPMGGVPNHQVGESI